MNDSTQEREVIRLGRFDSLGDELVVFNGYSDIGTYGWFVGSRSVDTRGGEPRVRLHPKVFFEGTDELGVSESYDPAQAKDYALQNAQESEYYAEFRSPRPPMANGDEAPVAFKQIGPVRRVGDLVFFGGILFDVDGSTSAELSAGELKSEGFHFRVDGSHVVAMWYQDAEGLDCGIDVLPGERTQ